MTVSAKARVAVTASRRRALERRDGTQGALISIAGTPLVNFCSTDYLGLASDPRLAAAAAESAAQYGLGAGAAGLLSGWAEPHHALATALADYMGRDRALLFSSGYLANLGTLSTFADRHSEIYQDRLNHASLIDGVRLSGAHSVRYRHADAADLESRLSNARAQSRLLVTDTVFSMDGDSAPLKALAAIAHQHDALLICDDAHGFGVAGQGRGAVVEQGLSQEDAPLVMVTFGKALGTTGAAVVGREDLVETLLQHARPFIYDTALPPMLASATLTALRIIQQEPRLIQTLHARIRYFSETMLAVGLTPSGLNSPIQPIMLGADDTALHAAGLLRAAGFYVRAIRPPTVPEGTARLRICLSAAHSEAQIDALVSTLKRVLPTSASGA